MGKQPSSHVKNKEKLKGKKKHTKKDKHQFKTVSNIGVRIRREMKNMPLRERLREQLKASRFRYVNEQFYASTSTEAKEYFSKHPEEFEVYHNGYQHQASLWPVNPVDVIIKELQRRPKSGKRDVIADFGCGKAKIAQTLNGTNYKVFSFDLVALNEFVTACDMANTHLYSNSVDVAVFCLSLMGSNISHFIREANRVLKDDGLMKIAEVKSRFDKVDNFIKNVEKFGFSLQKKIISDPLFCYFDFKKKSSISKNKKKNLPDIELNPCLYKHR